MKLYDLMKMTENDYDTYDTVYDACITVCFIEENETNDNYEKFCIELMRKVEIESVNNDDLVVKWTELIENNMKKFKAFTEKHWHKNCQYDDDTDEFIYQWINEIHAYMAGYVSEDFYGTLVKFVETLKA